MLKKGGFMSKIVKVFEDRVVIGLDGGGVTEARREDVDFEPVVGDEVDIFTSELTTYVSKKKDVISTLGASPGINPNGINITLQNTQTNTQPQMVMVAQGKLVKKIAYVLIALFLGGIGIHKFYAGKIGMGIMYILFCWTGIPAFIALIEAIIAAFKPADANGNIIV